MIEPWILLASAAAASKVLKPPIVRAGGKLGIPASAMAWAASIGALPVLGLLLVLGDIPKVVEGFVPALIVASGFGVFSAVFQARALAVGDISIVAPFEAVGIIFTAIGGFLLLNERISLIGVMGILVIVGGTFVLMNKRSMDADALRRNKEAIVMVLIASAIWGFSVNFEKVGIILSSAAFFAFWVALIMSILLSPFAWKSRRIILKNDGKRRLRVWIMAGVGIVTGLIMVFQFSAFELTNISYVLGVKQLSALAAPILGGLLFKEKGIIRRSIGAVLIVVGVILIMRAV